MKIAIAILLLAVSALAVAAPSIITAVDCGTGAVVADVVDYTSGPFRVNGGTVTIGSGVVGANGLNLTEHCTLNFVNDWANIPACTTQALIPQVQDAATTPTSSDLTLGSWLRAGTKFSWVCVGQKAH